MFDEKLETAVQIGDGGMLAETLPDEQAEGFYSFTPWWSRKENRTMIFLADTIFNKIFFYAQWN